MSRFFNLCLMQFKGLTLHSAEKMSPIHNKFTQFQWIYQTLLESKDQMSNCDMIILPEMWNTPYDHLHFSDYAELFPPEGEVVCPSQWADNMEAMDKKISDILTTEVPQQEAWEKTSDLCNGDPFIETHITCFILSSLARYYKTYIIGGSISEKHPDGNVYNTSPVFDNEGKMICTYRKTHLFDIDVPGKMTFTESHSLSPGEKLTVIAHPKVKIGLAICYDLRFPEIAEAYRRQDVELLVYPACFNSVTGPLFWEPLLTARAADAQMFVIGCGSSPLPLDNFTNDYAPHGHSMVISPWCMKYVDMDDACGGQFLTVDLNEVDEVRTQIPTYTQKRFDIYNFVKPYVYKHKSHHSATNGSKVYYNTN